MNDEPKPHDGSPTWRPFLKRLRARVKPHLHNFQVQLSDGTTHTVRSTYWEAKQVAREFNHKPTEAAQ